MSKTVNKKPISPKTTALLDKTSEVLNVISANGLLPDYYASMQKHRELLEEIMIADKPLFAELALTQRNIVELATEPLGRLSEQLNKIAAFQADIASQVSISQTIMANTIANSGLLEFINNFKSIQFEAFAGLTIKSELLESFETINNGFVTVSKVKESQYLAGGSLRLGIEKTTTTDISAQVVYKKLDKISAYVQTVDENSQITNSKIESIEKHLIEKDSLLLILENNPFKYFKIKKIDYHSGNGLLVVNNDISVKIPKYTRMEDLCTVLFSGHQELGEVWFLDSIQESWEALIDNENAKDITWKNILTTVADINTLFAKKTTREDLILIEKPKMIRLNPEYFLSKS